ncbi:MAG: hypothetical protein GY868_11845 [Deltaproteobacteria bacterium]|nr:hypothetical protein [Deltaproteobacteria bacterium]
MHSLDRRSFLTATTAALFAALLPNGNAADLPPELSQWRPAGPLSSTDAEPLPEITAAVDILMPADPDIADDFKGSDYGADAVVAASLGRAGQEAVIIFLNRYALQAANKPFRRCTAAEQLDAVKSWVSEREALQPLVKDLLTGLVSLAMIGTFENNDAQSQLDLFQKMGWYDPADPSGTFRTPNEGYPDVFQFPVSLKKGIKQ